MMWIARFEQGSVVGHEINFVVIRKIFFL